MTRSLTYGRVETLTTTDIATAFLNAPVDDSEVVRITVPQILTKLGLVKAATVWKVRKDVHGRKESP
eukprot:7714680-Prorocentrum_lima.AAC.1